MVEENKSNKNLTYKTTTNGFKKYQDTTTDWTLQLINTRETKEKKLFNK